MSQVTLYSFPTANGVPVSIFLEELGTPYTTVTMSIMDKDIGKVHNQVKSPWFLEEHKFSFHPIENPKEYSEVLQWLFFTHGGVGPMQGQATHFIRFAPEKIPYAQNRYLSEVKRLYSVLESRLSKHKWLAGGKYTVADIKTHGWVRGAPKMLDIDLAAEYPSLKDWLDRIEARPAVQKGLNVPAVDIEKAIAELTADADKSK